MGQLITPKPVFALMKISFTILLFIGFLATSSVAAPAKAQELLQERLSLSLKNASLKTLLNAIEKKIDVAFSYQKEVVTSPERIDIEIRDEPLETVLSRYLSPRQISYKVLKNNTIVLAKNGSRPVGIAVPGGSPADPNATHSVSSRLDAQTTDEVVRGRVTDEKGIPLPGVTITIQGGTRGTTSDASGRYSIAGLSPDDVLIFSSIGTETVKQPVGTRTIIDVVLRDEARTLDAVVVTALGFEAKRDQLGYATAKITGDNVGLSGEVGLIDALAGKASGVRIARTSGDPGASSQILIRGQSTITRGTDPLIVLDGVPISGDSRGETSTGTTQQSRLNDISADDIASVQVLKGASAAALWGTRAANGVIMITTKKGRVGTMNISVKSTLSIDRVSRFYDLQSAYSQGNNGVWSPTALRSWGDRIANRTGAADAVNTAGPSFVGNTGQTYYGVTAKNSREDFLRKNYDAVLGTGRYIDNSVSISGGDSQSNYFISFNDLNQKGVIQNGSTYRRTGLRVNAGRDFSKWLSISNNLTYSNINSDRIQTGVNNAGFLIGLLRNPVDVDIADYKGSYAATPGGTQLINRQRSYRNQIGASTNPGFNNPLWVTNELQNTSLVNRFINATELKIKPVQWFSLTTRLGLDYFTDRQVNYFPYFSANAITGQYSRQEYTESQFNIDVIGQANRQFNTNLSGTLLAGLNYNVLNTASLGGLSQNFILPDGPLDFDNATPSNISVTDSYLKRVTNAGYISGGIAYKEMLFVNATGRLEAASTFGELAKKVFFYPSADMAWQFSQLKVLQDQRVLSFGKLRAAYGIVGVQPQSYRTQTNFVSRTFQDGLGGALDPALYGTGTYVQSVTRGNPFLRPERKEEMEIGVDLRLFNDRLSLSLSHYRNETTDALINIPQASSTGYDFLYANAGTIQNRGLEVDLGYTLFKNKDWSVEWNLNWTRNRNIVTNLNGAGSINLGGTAGVSSRAVEGYALGVLFSTKWQRNENNGLILNANGFPIPDIVSAPIGDPNPDWRGGTGLNVKYKKLTFSALMEHSQGGMVINGTEGVLLDYGTSGAVGNESVATTNLKRSDGTVISAGTSFRGNIKDFGAGPVALDQSWYTGLGGWFGNVGEQFMEDATWTRFRELNLGYTLSHPGLKRALGLSSLLIEVSGRNLFLISSVQGFDPDSNVSGSTSGRGVVYFVNPPTRSYLCTLKLNF
jgi:TonB-linked SusC/RagA family outer membrane protein